MLSQPHYSTTFCCCPWPADAEIQSATLTADKPKGCLTEKLVQDTVGLNKTCFNSVTIYRQGGGADCNGFGVGLLDGNNSNCIAGPVGNGTLVPAKGECSLR